MGTVETVRTYELTYLLPGSMTDNEVAQARAEIETLLQKHKVTIVKNDDWGRKQMAYVIKHGGQKHVDAVYTHLVLEIPSLKASLIDRDVQLSAKVVRHLLIVSEGQTPDTEETKAEK
jgi:ribosomal protein S6